MAHAETICSLWVFLECNILSLIDALDFFFFGFNLEDDKKYCKKKICKLFVIFETGECPQNVITTNVNELISNYDPSGCLVFFTLLYNFFEIIPYYYFLNKNLHFYQLTLSIIIYLKNQLKICIILLRTVRTLISEWYN